MDEEIFDSCKYCDKRDICLGECSWNKEILDRSYANYYTENLGLKGHDFIESFMIERSMFGDYN